VANFQKETTGRKLFVQCTILGDGVACFRGINWHTDCHYCKDGFILI
jgi:hypothetical protein